MNMPWHGKRIAMKDNSRVGASPYSPASGVKFRSGRAPKRSHAASAAILLVLAALVLSCKRAPDTLSVSFVGDIIMHIPVKTCARLNDLPSEKPGVSANNGGFDYLFERIAPRLLESDMALGNMEFPVSAPFESRPYVFNCGPQALGALKKAGISLVTIANNHILDQKTSGALETLGHLKRAGIAFIGAGTSQEEAESGFVFERSGIRAGFIALTGVVNTAFPGANGSFHLNNFYKKDLVFQQIDAMKARADFVIMAAHAGAEYATGPLPADAALMREYCERGVDLIVGHHPHILQRIERFTAADGRTCHIFYSLGNFISNQSSEHSIGRGAPLSTRDSAIVTLCLERAGGCLSARYKLVPIRTVNQPVRHPSGRYYRSIQPVAIADELRDLATAGKVEPAKADALKARMEVIRTALLRGNDYDTVRLVEE